ALVEMCTLPTAARIEDLIQRLADLEGKLGGMGAPSKPVAPSAAPSASATRPSSPAPARRSSGDTQPPRATLASAPVAAEAAPQPAVATSPNLRLVESPAAVETAGSDDPVVRWRSAVDRVKGRKLLLGTCLEEGYFLGMAGTSVRIALSGEHAFHRAMLELKENREILNEELERLYGRGAKLLCESTIPPGAEPLGASATAGERPEPTRDATLVDRIVELFDGEVMNPATTGPEEGNV
ncbi:MAG TPA: hypothetical protein VFD83_02445, partial [Candidatus Polarisedimenticolia bacterium]|nr:hypothetical protein [Candidatus Polarisedimenticolia bacterium]